MNSQILYKQYEPEDFAGVIKLGNIVHGDNYLDDEKCQKYYNTSFKDGINASFVAYDGDELVGFRLTQAATNWDNGVLRSCGSWLKIRCAILKATR